MSARYDFHIDPGTTFRRLIEFGDLTGTTVRLTLGDFTDRALDLDDDDRIVFALSAAETSALRSPTWYAIDMATGDTVTRVLSGRLFITGVRRA